MNNTIPIQFVARDNETLSNELSLNQSKVYLTFLCASSNTAVLIVCTWSIT